MTTTILYSIWMLFPLFFLLVFLWGVLGKLTNKTRSSDNKDIFNQFIFVLIAVIACIAIDQWILPFIFPLLPDLLPPGMVRFILLPVVFVIMAKVIGPTKEIRIQRTELARYDRKK